MRTSAKANSRNKAYRNKIKVAIRNVNEASNKDEAQEALKNAVKVLDRSAGKGIIHKNRAADKISRLTAFVSKIEG